ncbi:hypothetical protein RJT34_11430 [Clitoria ternatea]|uniref:Uncharacterized protein n=1 Tax=Clitoria ternatea TaxID=43366 RepID=A0AAN9JMN9_CLITE
MRNERQSLHAEAINAPKSNTDQSNYRTYSNLLHLPASATQSLYKREVLQIGGRRDHHKYFIPEFMKKHAPKSSKLGGGGVAFSSHMHLPTRGISMSKPLPLFPLRNPEPPKPKPSVFDTTTTMPMKWVAGWMRMRITLDSAIKNLSNMD